MELKRKDDSLYDRKVIASLAHTELVEKGMSQIIEKPTHRQGNKESIIDMIFTNEPRKVLQWGNIPTGSSHDCVWMNRRSKYVQDNGSL